MVNENEYHVVWFDPGGTIGWAYFVVDFRAFSRPEHKILRWLKYWDCGELSGPEQVQLSDAVSHIDRVLTNNSFLTITVGGEDFELTQLIGGKNLLSPVRINAVLDWECHKRSIKYQYQARKLRTGVTKERLKIWGFDGRFKKDEFAAMQHGITWLRREKQKSLSKPWKLSEGSIMNVRWDCACFEGKPCDLKHTA